MSTATAIGVDFGGTSVKPAVVRDGVILERGNVIPTRQDGNSTALIGSIVDEINRLKVRHPDIEAVGFGLPGIINAAEGMVLNLTNVKGWRNIPLRSIVSRDTALPTNLENDAKAMAYAEWKHGAGEGDPDVVCVTLGTGIGGGLILNGRLYRGATMVAGEIGQMSIDYRGNDFVYGNKGALESYVGIWHISQRAKEIYAAASKSLSDEQAEPEKLSEAADAGDPLALELWSEIGLKLGVGLSNVVWLLNPHRIVIGGGVAKAGERLFSKITNTIRERTEKTFWETLQIMPAALGNDAGFIGAATLALESEFVLPKC
ncbi:MAG TPA: ROK family protein [Chthoniobacterales bacterium]|nr:ROK family protein [Chthoniobacterales bacterium]